jgi:hypothetical protein
LKPVDGDVAVPVQTDETGLVAQAVDPFEVAEVGQDQSVAVASSYAEVVVQASVPRVQSTCALAAGQNEEVNSSQLALVDRTRRDCPEFRR